jgi:hypothetical protein
LPAFFHARWGGKEGENLKREEDEVIYPSQHLSDSSRVWLQGTEPFRSLLFHQQRLLLLLLLLLAAAQAEPYPVLEKLHYHTGVSS